MTRYIPTFVRKDGKPCTIIARKGQRSEARDSRPDKDSHKAYARPKYLDME